MTISPGIAKRLRRHLELTANGQPDQVEALYLAQKLEPRKRIKREGPTRRAEKRAKDAARQEASAGVSAAVMERSGGCCEVCHSAIATEVHHLWGGSGRRRQMESTGTLVAACASCHRRLHAHPMENKALREQRAAAAAQLQVMADLAALLDPTAKRTP